MARRVSRRLTQAAKAQRQARAKAWAERLRTCTHDGHWIEVEPGVMVRCPCWRRAQQETV